MPITYSKMKGGATRTFDGKTFKWYGYRDKKREATSLADSLRRTAGKLVRINKRSDGGYDVWIRSR